MLATRCLTRLAGLALGVLSSTVCFAGTAFLTWKEPTVNTDGTPIVGPISYRVYWRCGVGVGYPNSVGPISGTSYVLSGLADDGTCYFAAQTIDGDGLVSDLSSPASKLMDELAAPGKPDVAIHWGEVSGVAIAFDAFSASVGELVADPSFTHTPVGTPRGILCYVIHATAETPTVTYGGGSMGTSVATAATASGELADITISAFLLGSSVPTGAQTLAVDAGASGAKAYCYSVTADQDVSFVNSQTIVSDALANPSATLTLGGVESFVTQTFGFGGNSGITSALTNWTVQQQTVSFDFLGGNIGTAGAHSYDIIGTSDVTIGYTAGTNDQLILAVAIRESAGGGGGSTLTAGTWAMMGVGL